MSDAVLHGWKYIAAHVNAFAKRPRAYSLDTVRKWAWLAPALETFNGGVVAKVEELERVLREHFGARS